MPKWIDPEKIAPSRRRQPGTRTLGLVSARHYHPRKVKWLWRPYIPLGKLSLLAGPQGQGKSQLTTMLAAAVSNSTLVPSDVHEPADVVMVSAEDDPHDTITPRLAAADADFDRVSMLDVWEADREGDMFESALALPDDVPRLRKAMEGRNVKLVVIDPVSSHLGSATDSHRNTDVRRAIGPLRKLASEFGAAILIVTHLSKGSGGDPLDRVIDSVAYTALARSVLLFNADPMDMDGTRGSKKVVVIGKSNLSPPGDHALRVEIEPAVVSTDDGEDIATSKMTPRGVAEGITASDLVLPLEDVAERREAAMWVRETLAEGWRPTAEVEQEFRKRWRSERTWRAVRDAHTSFAKAPGSRYGRVWRGLHGTDPPWTDDPTWRDNTGKSDNRDNSDNMGAGGLPQESEAPNLPNLSKLNGHHDSAEDYRRMRDRMLGERDDDEVF